MRAPWALLGVASWLLATACGGGSDGSAFVLVGRQARAAGLELRIDGRPVAAGSLPVEVPDPTERVELRGADRPRRLELRAGTLTWVRGPGAVEPLALGTDVRADALYVQAGDAFVRRFAAALGARPPTAAAAGTWMVEGPEALARSSWMSAPPEIFDAEPVPTLRSSPAAAPATSGLGRLLRPPVAASSPAGSPAERAEPDEPSGPDDDDPAALAAAAAASVVGFYSAPNGPHLLLNAEGGFTLGTPDRCGDRHHEGRYRVEDGRVSLENLGLELVVQPDGSLAGSGVRFAARGGS